jgi:hypothetical protein
MSPVTETGTQPGQIGRMLKNGNMLRMSQPCPTDTVSPTTASPPAAATCALTSSEMSYVEGSVTAE